MAEKLKHPTNLSIDISFKTIIFTVFFLLFIKFLYNIKETLIILFIAFILVVAINPMVDWLHRRRIPRTISTLTILLLVFMGAIGTIASLISPLFAQTEIFLQKIPSLVEQLAPYKIDFSSVASELSSLPGNFIKIAQTTFSGFITFFTLLVVSFYLLQSRPKWPQYTKSLFGAKGNLIYSTIEQVEVKLGHWVRGELILMFIVGFGSYLGFALIGLPYAIPLAVISGMLEIVPNIGPVITAIPVAIVGFTISPTHGLLSLLVLIIVQQLENHVIVPTVMRKAVGLHPVITIISIIIGLRLGGVALAVLALPTVLTLQVIISHLRFDNQTNTPTFE